MTALVELRKFPPVPEDERPDRPRRLSQTFLRTADRCRRAGLLYLKYRGGPTTHALDRGSVFHLFAERAVNLLIEQDEPQLPPEIAKDLMAECLADPRFTVPSEEVDGLRVMAYHFAEGVVIDPATVVAVERKFVLDIGGWQVVGKLDVAWLRDQLAGVFDWKTTYAIPPQDEFDQSFQTPLYALCLAEGKPIVEHPCQSCDGGGEWFNADGQSETCEACDGHGYTEEVEPYALAAHADFIELAELYPRFLWNEGMAQRTRTVSRAELHDFRLQLEALVSKVDSAFESGNWPAVVGDHCSECPAPSECPIPAHLRAHRGSIDTVEQAAEAAERIDRDEADLSARKTELRNTAKHLGPIRFGRNLIYEFQSQERTEVRKAGGRSDWPGLAEAIERSVQFGEPFDLDQWLRRSASTTFKKRKLTGDELAAEQADTRSADEKYGETLPE